MSTPNIKLPRRVVTGIRNGKSVFISDGPAPNSHIHQALPGFMHSVCWAMAPVPQLPLPVGEAAPAGIRITPAPGETRLLVVCFPPDAVMADPAFDGHAAAAEQARLLPGLADCFEPDHPGMHSTESVDYDIVLNGEIWLELDDGAQVHLQQGDVVVQCGTRHAWRNKGSKSATMAFVLVGADSGLLRGRGTRAR
jgi:mannose-6-phosphate isomerase-like protein (cupin superfamily)